VEVHAVTLSQAVEQAVDQEMRGVVCRDTVTRKEVKVFIAFDRLWTNDENGAVVLYAPTVLEAIEDWWAPSNDI
jgi:hypothetical protein